jgi:lactocepin
MLVSYFAVYNNTKVNENSPDQISGFAGNRLNWKVYIQDSSGNTVFTKTVENTSELHLNWAPTSDIPNGTYKVFADAENAQGFKVAATASNTVTVVH